MTTWHYFWKKRKNDQFREGSWIYIATSKGSPCPVRLTRYFFKASGHKGNDYLFRRVSHTKSGYTLRHHKLSYTRALELVRVQLKSIGLEPEEYGLHSMRSGGASLAAALGIPDRLIMRQGGWKQEESKNNYIKETRDTLLHISRACIRIVGPQFKKKGERVVRPERHSSCVDLSLSKAALFALPCHIELILRCQRSKSLKRQQACFRLLVM